MNHGLMEVSQGQSSEVAGRVGTVATALIAQAIGADKTYLFLPARSVSSVRHALGERSAAGLDRCRVALVEAPDTFVAGEESAVVRRIEGGPALPRPGGRHQAAPGAE